MIGGSHDFLQTHRRVICEPSDERATHGVVPGPFVNAEVVVGRLDLKADIILAKVEIAMEIWEISYLVDFNTAVELITSTLELRSVLRKSLKVAVQSTSNIDLWLARKMRETAKFFVTLAHKGVVEAELALLLLGNHSKCCVFQPREHWMVGWVHSGGEMG